MPGAKLAIEPNADGLSFFVPQIGKPVLNNNAKVVTAVAPVLKNGARFQVEGARQSQQGNFLTRYLNRRLKLSNKLAQTVIN